MVDKKKLLEALNKVLEEKGKRKFVQSVEVMINMRGIDFTKSVRGTPAISKIPIVMITSNAEKEHVLSAVMAGVNDYMVKPFTPDIFAQKIKKALGI